MEKLVPAATILLIVYALLSAVDSLWLHLVRYRLYLRPQSRFEHFCHTVMITLFPLSVFFLYRDDVTGVSLWLGAAAAAALLLVELVDMASEKNSRADLGGVSRMETNLHFVMGSSRAASTALIIASKPAGAWSLDAGAAAAAAGSNPAWVDAIIVPLVGFGVVIAVLHAWLLWRGAASRGEPVRAAR